MIFEGFQGALSETPASCLAARLIIVEFAEGGLQSSPLPQIIPLFPPPNYPPSKTSKLISQLPAWANFRASFDTRSGTQFTNCSSILDSRNLGNI